VANVVAERRRTVAGSLATVTEADVVASLEAESSRLAADLSAAESAADSLSPEREALESLEEELRSDEARFLVIASPGRVAGSSVGEPSAQSLELHGRWCSRRPRQHDAALTRLSNAREAVARLTERLASSDRCTCRP